MVRYSYRSIGYTEGAKFSVASMLLFFFHFILFLFFSYLIWTCTNFSMLLYLTRAALSWRCESRQGTSWIVCPFIINIEGQSHIFKDASQPQVNVFVQWNKSWLLGEKNTRHIRKVCKHWQPGNRLSPSDESACHRPCFLRVTNLFRDTF